MRNIATLTIAGAAGTALVFGAAAAPAQAQINLVGGIGKVKLNNTVKQVKGKLGAPDKKYTVQTEVPAGTMKVFEYGTDGYYYKVDFFGGKVFAVTTANPKQQTWADIGPGSSKSDLKAAYGAALNKVSSKLFELGDRQPGQVITIFRIANKKVSTVQVSRYTGE